MKDITVSSSKTKTAAVDSDRYMIERGFRRPTKEESVRFRRSAEKMFIEKHAGGYVVRRAGSARATAVSSTQAEAIQKARKLSPSAPIHVERVRDVHNGRQDTWRKA